MHIHDSTLYEGPQLLLVTIVAMPPSDMSRDCAPRPVSAKGIASEGIAAMTAGAPGGSKGDSSNDHLEKP